MPEKYTILKVRDVAENSIVRYNKDWWEKYTGMYNVMMLWNAVTCQFVEVSDLTMVGLKSKI